MYLIFFCVLYNHVSYVTQKKSGVSVQNWTQNVCKWHFSNITIIKNAETHDFLFCLLSLKLFSILVLVYSTQSYFFTMGFWIHIYRFL